MAHKLVLDVIHQRSDFLVDRTQLTLLGSHHPAILVHSTNGIRP